jgi:hypothetical protein
MSWELLFGLGALALFLALAWGFIRYKTRNRANDAITEEATRQMREDPEAYDNGGRARLQRELKPD